MEAQREREIETVTTDQSLLDRIVDRQAEAAARLMPVMTIAQTRLRQKAIQELKELILEEGLDRDYGTIPGTKKPTLLQPGAQKICAFFGYVPTYEILTSIEDWMGERYGGEPLFYYHVRCTLSKDEFPVGQAMASCNSWETKYRYRESKRICPQCGTDAIIAGKAEYGGGWLCWTKRGGCGAKFSDDDPVIATQALGRTVNEEYPDVINPVQKIACKRAYVSATLSATGASQYFTVDLEDSVPPPSPPPEASPPPRRQEQQKPASNGDKLPTDFKGMMTKFAEMKSIIGEKDYYEVLFQFDVDHSNKLGDMKRFHAAYNQMSAIAKGEK